MDIEELRGNQEASRRSALQRIDTQNATFNHALLTITEINEAAIYQYESWLAEHDFGWERVLGWKTRLAHASALDVAVWYEGVLAGMCWASPKSSHDKVFVLYLQRHPDNRLPTRGLIAPLCLSAVTNYAVLMGWSYVVIDNPLPKAREVYLQRGLAYLPGIGLAYRLPRAYDPATN